MNTWNSILLVLSIFPLLLTMYFISNFFSQIRKNWKKINYLVLGAAIITFAHSCWQVSFFLDERFYLLLPFPQDYFSHIYLFIIPVILGCLAIPKLYPNLSKILYGCLFMSVILAILGMFTYQGKDLIWFSISLSTLLVLIGLKEEQFGLYYKNYIKFIFLENTWVALFYFQNEKLFAIGLVLQLVSRFYFFNFLNLFWIQSFFKKNQTINESVEPTTATTSGLLKD